MISLIIIILDIERKRGSRRESKLLSMENIKIDDMIYKEKIIKEIQEKNESMMAKEIEEYIEESMKKMYAEMDEIKSSYEDSIKEALGIIYYFYFIYI